MTDLTDPVDPTHRRQSLLLLKIQSRFDSLAREIARWDPRPCPLREEWE